MDKPTAITVFESLASSVRLDDLPLFAVHEPEPVSGPSPTDEALAAINPDDLSPREALEALYQLKKLAGG